MGDSNVVIGNENKLKGDDNWVISRDKYHGKVSNYLVFQKWAIDIDNKRKILSDPGNVIKHLDKTAERARTTQSLCSCVNNMFHNGGHRRGGSRSGRRYNRRY